MDKLWFIDKARQALMEAKTVEEVADIRDKAETLIAYLKKKKNTTKEVINVAQEFAIETDLELGHRLKEMPKNTGEKGQFAGGRQDRPPIEAPPTLKEMGISKDESSNLQRLVEHEEEIKEEIVQIKEAGGDIDRKRIERDIIKKERRKERDNRIIALSQETTPFTDKNYPVIYADPPWQYEHCATDSRKIENQYPTMPLADIIDIPVPRISCNDCILFMWSTAPKLEEALHVICKWGFTYRTNIVWDKQKLGMGYYARSVHELLLIATRGNMPVPIEAARPRSIISYPRGSHSEKPECFYEIIESMYPRFNRIELFARKKRNNWDFWGNEICSRS